METQTALVRTDSRVELYAVAKVSLNLTIVIYPSNTECEDTIGLNDTLNDLCLLELGGLVLNLLDRLQYLLNCLQVLALARVLGLQLGH